MRHTSDGGVAWAGGRPNSSASRHLKDGGEAQFYTLNNQVVAERNTSTGLSWMLPDNQNATYATLNADNLAVAQRWQDPFYHGADVPSLIDILNNGLDASKAAASYTDGPGGFFVATHASDAEFFAVRNGSGAVIKVKISDGAMTQLRDAGAVQRAIPTGPKSPTFAGEEFHIPTSAFDLFNQLRASGEITVSP
ncbi:hypothetical protein [Amycolatopsis taiwanensis]|uniref:Uncharacterized protein n=1 Tax=Amycolatopsis taiwanensis TaxID=342230 RepID=A0A9W6VI82_9PSEU|nr:hypothetical protein [Amycolatopsis taiwanensis]GLY67236.1 hypothetical protein Atai01_38550 [Amycolatopsis taiwanensis]